MKYSDIKKYYYGLIVERGLKATTVDHVHTILRPAFQMAVRDGLIRTNPTGNGRFCKDICMTCPYYDRCKDDGILY